MFFIAFVCYKSEAKSENQCTSTLVLSWNWWMTNARTVSQLPAEVTLHRTVEPIPNRTFSRVIHKMSQNLSDNIL